MNGVIIGGWEYVWAAYLITWAALALYGGSLWLRAVKASAASPRPGAKQTGRER